MGQLVAHPLGYLVDPDAGLIFGSRGVPIGSLDTSGYLQVDGRSRGLGMLSAHRLVWEAIEGPIPDELEINHVDGIKTHNGRANLELVTRSGNILHAFRTGLKSNAGEHHPSHILTDELVREIRAAYRRYSREAGSIALARQFGVSHRQVRAIVAGNSWGHVA